MENKYKNKYIFIYTIVVVLVTLAAVFAGYFAFSKSEDNRQNTPDENKYTTVDPTISLVPTATETATPTPSSTIQPTFAPLQYAIKSFKNSVVGPEGVEDRYYIFTPSCQYTCERSECKEGETCDMYFVAERDIKSKAEKDILGYVATTNQGNTCPDQPFMNSSYVLLAKKKKWSHAEPPNLSYYDANDVSIYINVVYQGIDNFGDGEYFIFLISSYCSSASDYLIPTSYIKPFPLLADLKPGDIVAIQGIFSEKSAAAGTSYQKLVSDLDIRKF